VLDTLAHVRLSASALPLLLLALALPACGEEEGNGLSPEATARRYLAAEKAADGERICALYSADYRKLIEDESDGSCAAGAEAVAKLSQHGPHRLLSLDESGGEATATVSCDDPTASDCSLPLVKEDGSWRVDSSPSPND
jgi:hypothetical protein